MEFKHIPFFSLNNQNFILFFIILSNISNLQALSFKYPIAFNLENENILVIHSLGIDICDFNCTSSQRKVTFGGELSESDISKIAISRYSTGVFLIFNIDIVYIFDKDGNYIIEAIDLYNFDAEYYAIAAHKIVKDDFGDDNYYYLLGYINITSTGYNLILNYNYNDGFMPIVNNRYSKSFTDTDNIVSQGLSCQFMKNASVDYIICIYQISRESYNFRASIFTINKSPLSIVKKKDFDMPGIKYIQSVTKLINSKPFFCGINELGEPYCFIFDLSEDEEGLSYIFPDENFQKKCKAKPYNVKTYYFSETGEYVFSCLTNDNIIQTTIYDKNMEEIEDIQNPSMRLQTSFQGCEEFYYSIIYSKSNNNYYIISDIDCDSFLNFMPLTGEIEEVEKYEFNLDEEEKEILKEYYHNIEEKIEEEYIQEKKEEYIQEKEEKCLQVEEEEKIVDIEIESYIVNKEEEIGEKESEKRKKEKIEESYNLDLEEKEKKIETIEEYEETYEKEKEINNTCILEKCSECNEESIKLNLCQKCNRGKGYYPLNFEDNLLFKNYFECYNKQAKPQGVYFDEQALSYKLCYSSCKTCNYGGDGNENNCTSCKNNQILKPDIIPNSTNCVAQCPYFYYYKGDKYRCTDEEKCPDDYQLEIKEKKKCIDKCENDNEYNVQYDGECYKDPPEGTKYNELKNIFEDIDINKCNLNEKILRLPLNEIITENEIKKKAKLYAKEFDYTNKHITIYKNDFYSITIYKDNVCPTELSLNIDEIDFGNCYTKVKNKFNITGDLIIVIISKNINDIFKTIDKFMFNPYSGEKINFIELCMNETITVKKDLKEQLKITENYESMEELTEQGINIFNPNDEFYTDLCFHFKSPINGKDIPLKDRLKLFHPNITLCDEGCNIRGVNLTTWKANCECTLTNIMNTNLLGNNFLVQKSLGEFQDFLTNTNIEVMKCYKDIFDGKMYKKNTGMIIVLVLIFIQLIWIFIYYFKYKIGIKKYALSLTDIYISSLIIKSNSNSNSNPDLISSSNDSPKSSPPKSKIEYRYNPKIKNEAKYEKNINNIKNANANASHKSSKIKVLNMSKDLNQNSNDKFYINKEIIKDKNKEYEPIMPNLRNNININIEEYMKADPDDMDYDEAIKEDKRTFCNYFFEKIRIEQMILYTFFKKENLNPLPIKLILLILNIDLYLIINALFFNEDYISDLLKIENDTILLFFNRILDRIINVTITGVIINYIIEFFFVNESKIKRIFRFEKDNTMFLKYEIVQIVKNTYIRYNIFIIISSIIMLFSLYYIFCFNNIYPFMKGEWIKSSVVIISFMQIFPIILCLLNTLIRFISLRCKSERLFRLSSNLF